MTKRALLVADGWAIAPIYVGQQITGLGSHNPSAATGIVDGKDTANLMSSEDSSVDRLFTSISKTGRL
jgi:hypothetical protein